MSSKLFKNQVFVIRVQKYSFLAIHFLYASWEERSSEKNINIIEYLINNIELYVDIIDLSITFV